MTLGPEGLTEQAQGFADRLAALLRAVLPDAPDVSAERRGDRVVVSPQSDVPLLVSGERLAHTGDSHQVPAGLSWHVARG